MNRHYENDLETALRRDDILSAVGFASSVFLQSANWREVLGVALQRLGEATRANRAYFFENHLREDGATLTSQLAEWAAEGIAKQIDNDDLQDFPYEEMGLIRWVEVMSQRKPIYGLISSFPASEREVFESQGIQSLIAMPVFSQDQFIGFLGFDDCESLREWSPSEFDALFAAAAALGAAIDRHHLEHQLRFSQKMKAIDSLASGVAHDFNNMLQAVVALTHVVKLKLDDGNSAQSDLDKILAATERAHSLTRQLLSFSRKQTSSPKAVSLERICDSVATMMKPVLDGRIELTVNVASPSPVIFADEGLISQVLLNVCLNARDAMPHGGTLEVRCDREQVGANRLELFQDIEPGEFAVVSVRDNGCGMNQDVRDRVFEPFFTTKAIGEGTGLGLSVAYGTVRQCGGFIDVASAPGEGTQFQIFIPTIASDDTEMTTPASVVGGHETILLVDDEPMVLQSMTMLLQAAGYKVLVANDGVEGLEQYQAHADEIALVLSDTMMPRMDGASMIQSVLASDEHAKAILLSGYSLALPSYVTNPNNFSVLQKPVRSEVLYQAIRKLLS